MKYKMDFCPLLGRVDSPPSYISGSSQNTYTGLQHVLPFLALLILTHPPFLTNPPQKASLFKRPRHHREFPRPSLHQRRRLLHRIFNRKRRREHPHSHLTRLRHLDRNRPRCSSTLPSWSTGNTWAPDVFQLADGSFVMYFCATLSSAPSMHCVGTATSSTVDGHYNASSTVLACPTAQGGAIDPAGFQDSDGSLYVVYKIDGNSLGGGGTCGNGNGEYSTPIMLQTLESDGVTPSGDPVQILDRDAADGPLIEAPDLILHEGTYFLFFSSNCFNGPDYDTSYATASSITGPYTKASSPLLVSGGDNGALNSPGGATVGPDGTQMVFHSDSESGNSAVRQMWTAGIAISGGTVSIS